MITEFKLFENQSIKLIDAYDDELPEKDEIIWDFITLDDFYEEYPIIDIDVEFYFNQIKDSISNANKEQKKLISYYTRSIYQIINDYIIVSGDILIDGHHRIVAFHNNKIKTVKGIDLEND